MKSPPTKLIQARDPCLSCRPYHFQVFYMCSFKLLPRTGVRGDAIFSKRRPSCPLTGAGRALPKGELGGRIFCNCANPQARRRRVGGLLPLEQPDRVSGRRGHSHRNVQTRARRGYGRRRLQPRKQPAEVRRGNHPGRVRRRERHGRHRAGVRRQRADTAYPRRYRTRRMERQAQLLARARIRPDLQADRSDPHAQRGGQRYAPRLPRAPQRARRAGHRGDPR